MAAQKLKKNCQQKFFAFLNASYPKTHLIQSLNSLDSSRPYGRLLENQKVWGSTELFQPKRDFQNSFTNIFPQKHPDIGRLKTNLRDEIKTTYELNII